jgi:hypothetical protein
VYILQVALVKVPLARCLWQRLARACTSLRQRLDAWQRAVKAAAAALQTPSMQEDPPPSAQRLSKHFSVGGEGRRALELWLHAHVAAAADLVHADRRGEA